MALSFDGLFVIWSYDVSHAKLLLRRTKGTDFVDDTKSFKTRIDVLFKGVELIFMPTSFYNLVIEEIDAKKLPKSIKSISNADTKNLKIYKLSGNSNVGYVLSLAMFWEEDELEYNEASSLLP